MRLLAQPDPVYICCTKTASASPNRARTCSLASLSVEMGKLDRATMVVLLPPDGASGPCRYSKTTDLSKKSIFRVEKAGSDMPGDLIEKLSWFPLVEPVIFGTSNSKAAISDCTTLPLPVSARPSEYATLLKCAEQTSHKVSKI